jgi:hypothetical protein
MFIVVLLQYLTHKGVLHGMNVGATGAPSTAPIGSFE